MRTDFLATILAAPLVIFASVASPAAEMRTWKTADGKEIEAELVDWTPGKGVRLRQADGKEIQIGVPKLAPRDRMYVRRHLKTAEGKSLPREENDQKPAETTWRKTGDYPLIAGRWCESEEENIFLIIRQNGERFVADCRYRNAEGVEVHWRAEGTVSAQGQLAASLQHTRPEGYASQTRTGQLSPDGNTIRGHAEWTDGGHDFEWSLRRPLRASTDLIAAERAASTPAAPSADEEPVGEARSAGRKRLPPPARQRELLRQNLLADLQEKQNYTPDQLREVERKLATMSDSQVAALLERYVRAKKSAGENLKKLSLEKTHQGPRPSRSGPVALTPDGAELWAVVEDGDRVIALRVLDEAPYLERIAMIPVGRRPRSIAISPDGGTIYVTNQHSASLAVIDRARKQVTAFVPCGWASQPWGVVTSPDGQSVFVSASAASKVLKFGVGQGGAPRLAGAIAVPNGPWAMAMTPDSRRLFVTQGINGGPYQSNDPGLVTRIDTASLAAHPIPVAKDDSRDTGGYVSMLRSIVILPGGRWALVAAQQIDADRGMVRDNRPSLSFKTEIQPVVCVIDLFSERENRQARIVLSRVGAVINGPSAVDWFALDDGYFGAVAGQGSEDVKILKCLRNDEVQVIERGVVRVGGGLAKWPSGAAPDGLCVDPLRKRLYVLNFLNRSISVVAITPEATDMQEVAELRLVGHEPLSGSVLRGKKVFYSSELGTSKDSWIACANCHPDGGGSDRRIWDFSQFGGSREGSARTLSLRGTTAHRMRFFWQGRSDEVQDLETGVRALFGGQFINGEPYPSMEKPNAGRSPDFDAVAAYIHFLDRVLPSPFRQPDGQLTPAARQGRTVFYDEAGCDFCHRPENRFCHRSRRNPGVFEVFDVGTGNKYNVPALTGAWEGGPWLHDGRAATIAAIFGKANKSDSHGTTSHLSSRQIDCLAEFVLSIDEGADVRSSSGRIEGNQPPVAQIVLPGARLHAARSLGTQVEPEQPVSLLGSRSFDPDGNIISWRWSFGPGTEPIEARGTFGDLVYHFPAGRKVTYRVTLTVTDDQGASAEKSVYVGVGCTPDPQNVYQGR